MTEVGKPSNEALIAKAEEGVRPGVQRALTGVDATVTPGDPEVAAEDPLARFKAQYDVLPKTNILAAGSTWETVQARLSAPENADKLKKVQKELQGGGRLYAVKEDGTCEFMDDNAETPPMFVKDKARYAEDQTLQIIFKRDPDQMAAASAQIDAGAHEWASIQEMLNWAQANGFEVFEGGTKDEHWFSKEMELAQAASTNQLFVGKQGGPSMATALKDARFAHFNPVVDLVIVYNPEPKLRYDNVGLLRRLRI